MSRSAGAGRGAGVEHEVTSNPASNRMQAVVWRFMAEVLAGCAGPRNLHSPGHERCRGTDPTRGTLRAFATPCDRAGQGHAGTDRGGCPVAEGNRRAPGPGHQRPRRRRGRGGGTSAPLLKQRGDLDMLAGLEENFAGERGSLVVLVELAGHRAGGVVRGPAPLADGNKLHGHALVRDEAGAVAADEELVADADVGGDEQPRGAVD